MSPLLTSLIPPALAATLTAIATPVVRELALRKGATAAVREDRWHEKPTPAVGGVAIVLGFALAMLVGSWLLGDVPAPGVAERAVLPIGPREGLLAAVLLIAVVGFVDDMVQLSPATKLAGQLAASGLLIFSGIGVWLTGQYAADVAISFFWFVGITNALNLLDNMDGVAAGVGTIAAVFIGLNLLLDGQIVLATVAFTFAGAIAGFLVHNYPPARIFMGDSGSLFIGLSLAGLALSPSPGLSRSLFAVAAVPVAILAIPILDTTFVTIARIVEGRPVSQGGRDHTSHGLVALGISDERAMWILWILAFLGGLVGLLVRTATRSSAILLGGGLLVLLSLVGAFLFTARLHRVGVEDASDTGLVSRLRTLHDRLPVLPLLLDGLLIALAYYAAYLVRWDADRLPAELAYFGRSVLPLVGLKLVSFTAVGMYRAGWRDFSMADAMRVVRANITASLVAGAVLFLVAPSGLSRGVLITDFLIALTFTGVGRFSFRWMERARDRWSVQGRSVVLVGSVAETALALEFVRRFHAEALRPLCVVVSEEHGGVHQLRDLPVLHGVDGLARALERYEATCAVVVRRGESGSQGETLVRDFTADRGAVDVMTLRVDFSA